MSLADQIGAGTNPAVNKMKKFFIDGERKVNFGDSSLKLFEMTSSGLSPLLELFDGWTGRHVVDPKLGRDEWEIEIIDTYETTIGIMNKIATMSIGANLNFKAPKRDVPAANHGIWKLITELV